MMRRTPVAVLLALLALSGCSTKSEDGGSEPFRTPKYPPHAVVLPTVPPSTFSSGPAYDWEHPTDFPRNIGNSHQWHFANTKTFEETSAWLKKTMTEAVEADRSQKYSDFHFRGCIFEWQELELAPTHVNEYDFSVNLADATMTQMFAFSTSFRLGWDGAKNPVLFRAWEKEEGRWKNLGERLQDTPSRDFAVTRKDLVEPLRYAWVHAARLCGAKLPEN
jgi:hypothetical protein